MSATIEYLRAIEFRYGCATGKELADLLQVAEMSVSRYRNGSKGFADHVAIRAAQLLDLPPEIVLLDLHEERAETPEARQVWHELADKMRALLKSDPVRKLSENQGFS